MVYRIELTYNEIMVVLDLKYARATSIEYNLPPGIYEISDNNLMLKSLFPEDVKIYFRIDVNRLRSNLTTNKTIRFFKKTFFHTKFGFT